jgi:hypothetical protein
MRRTTFLAIGVSLFFVAAIVPLTTALGDVIPVCTAPGDQSRHQIISDGAGGAIITWQDARGTHADIYAQRIDLLGQVQWTTDGIAISTEVFLQWIPQLVSDGAGGAIITWQDRRSGYKHDIYAQRVNANGGALWALNGAEVCESGSNKAFPEITTDGAGGAIITWHMGGGLGIYAQRMDANGNALWAAIGVLVCDAAGDQWYPRLASDGVGGAFVIWEDGRNGNKDIYAQRVNASGDTLWVTDGIEVCTQTADQESHQLIADGAGGAIITWHDLRAPVDWNIYAQKIDANGDTLWTKDGVAICTAADYQQFPQLVSDGAGGAIIVWHDRRGGVQDIYAQRVDLDGNLLWGTDGVAICTTLHAQQDPEITSSSNGGAIITWEDGRGGGETDIYAQEINSLGVIQWAADGVPISTMPGDQILPRLIPCGNGGAIIAWQDSNTGIGKADIFAADVDSTGELPVPTLLQRYDYRLSDNTVTIEWTLSEAGTEMEFFVFRAASLGGVFERLSDPEITRRGLSFVFQDKSCRPGETYRYRVEVSDESGRRILFETDTMSFSRPPLTLYRNYPNPFNPSTTIRYYVPEKTKVTLSIYDAHGRVIRVLVDAKRKSGWHLESWDGKNTGGKGVSSGVYFCRLAAGKRSQTQKMVLLR